MISYRDLFRALNQLGIERHQPVMVHASQGLSQFVRGGNETILAALLAVVDGLAMPAFTHQTMIIPAEGPANNGMDYGNSEEQNSKAEFYSTDLPMDKDLGTLVEQLRLHPQSGRSIHPILSFTGVGVDMALQTQSWSEPFSVISILENLGSWVLLMGVDHSRNISLHYAERLARRKQFIRWALTPNGIVECPNFPGCSKGFHAIEPQLENMTREAKVDKLVIRAFPMKSMLYAAREMINKDRNALLCTDINCRLCNDVRKSLSPS